MKVKIELVGCDDITGLEKEITSEQFEFLQSLVKDFAKESIHSCMPKLRVGRINRFSKYCDYIKNAGKLSIDGSYLLLIKYFDSDWNPIGKQVRKDMIKNNLIEYCCGGKMIKLFNQEETDE